MPGDPTWLTSGSEAQAQAVAKATSALDGLTLSSPPAAPAAPAPVVISPGAPHDATLLLLPGFTCSAESMAESWMPAISETLGDRGGRLKLVFLNAPEREVSCYGDERPRLQCSSRSSGRARRCPPWKLARICPRWRTRRRSGLVCASLGSSRWFEFSQTCKGGEEERAASPASSGEAPRHPRPRTDPRFISCSWLSVALPGR